METIKAVWAKIFSVEFLLKILIITAIFAILNFMSGGLQIRIYHQGGVDIDLENGGYGSDKALKLQIER